MRASRMRVATTVRRICAVPPPIENIRPSRQKRSIGLRGGNHVVANMPVAGSGPGRLIQRGGTISNLMLTSEEEVANQKATTAGFGFDSSNRLTASDAPSMERAMRAARHGARRGASGAQRSP